MLCYSFKNNDVINIFKRGVKQLWGSKGLAEGRAES
jgi:hypothetical protein